MPAKQYKVVIDVSIDVELLAHSPDAAWERARECATRLRLPYPAPGLRLAHVDDQDVYDRRYLSSSYRLKAPNVQDTLMIVDLTRNWVCSTWRGDSPLGERQLQEYTNKLPEWEYLNEEWRVKRMHITNHQKRPPPAPETWPLSFQEITERILEALAVPYETGLPVYERAW